MRQVLVLVCCLAAFGVVAAGGLEEGDSEVTLRGSFSDLDRGSEGGFDLGSSENTGFSMSWGRLVSGGHEFGLLVGYGKDDIDGGDDPEEDERFDQSRFGGFYNYNFSTGSDTMTPYAGAFVATLGGDLGDLYDLSYGAELGVKIYPWEHGGFSAGLNYTELKSDAQGLPDADAISLGFGILLKY